MSNFKRLCLLGAASCGILSMTAEAQNENYYSREKYESVRDRPQPAFDPEPIRVGTFLVRSNANGSVTYIDNVLATDADTQSDVIARVGVQGTARTNWNVHELSFDASASHNEYLDTDSESTNDIRAVARGRFDVSRDFHLGGSLFVESEAEPRTDVANSVGLDAPVEVVRTGGGLEATYQSDRFRWNNAADFAEHDYKDGRITGSGLPFDQDYRDVQITSALSRLSYALTPNVAVFGQATVRERSYDQTQTLGGVQRSRDSTGYTAAVGVDFELNALVRGDVAVGYMQENKKDSFFKDVDGLSVDARMQWFPSRLTTVGFSAGRRVVDIGLFESPSALQTSGSVRVDHELRRNIILSADAVYSSYDYQEIDRTDDVAEFGVTATYKMNKRMQFDAFARHTNRDASGSQVSGSPSYDVNVIGVGLRIYP
ncbi:outer membrane beta-barrel protein [Hyphomonas johnsonii]|nr:outer membrane beta-barrel protein [Hyphomonas johnsonii]